MSDELYGKAGIESDLGYVPAQMEGDVAPEPALSQNEVLDQYRELAPEKEIVEVKFQDPDGNERPPNETLDLEQAARGLNQYRERNRAATEESLNAQVAAEADALRAGKPADQMSPEELAAYNQLQQQEQRQPQTESLEDWSRRVQQPGQGSALPAQAEVSDEQYLTELLQKDPRLLSGITALSHQHEQAIATAKQAFTDGLTQNAALAVGAVISIPELQGITDLSQIPLALQLIQKQNPQRAQEIANQVARADQVVRQAQALHAAEQQRQAEAYKTQFAQFAKAQDDLFEKAMPEMADAAHAYRVGKDAMETLKNVGFSEEDVSRAYRGEASVSLRDYRAQVLIAKAAAYDRAIAAIPQAMAKPIPGVQRPGSSIERDLRQNYSPPIPKEGFKSVKEATEFLIQRRAARR